MKSNSSPVITSMVPFVVLVVVSIIATALALGWVEPSKQQESRTIDVLAYQFGFEPKKIKVKVGEEVYFNVMSQDVTHGFYIDGTDVNETLEPFEPKLIGPVTFDKPGKLKIRCANFCGPLHPFMVADLVVVSTLIPLFPSLVGLAIIVCFAMLIYLWRTSPTDSLIGITTRRELDLMQVRFVGPMLRKFFHWRPSHFLIVLPNLWVILIIFTAAAVGNALGALNFSITTIWILWFCLVEFWIFFFGRLWCMMCPLPFFGDWIVRMRVAAARVVPAKWLSLNWKWPKWLNNSWVSSVGFLGMSLPIVWLITRPSATGLLFLAMMVFATLVPLFFDGSRRRFCDHLCPAFYIGYHSSTSMVAISPRDEEICKKHMCKECMQGNSKGYGCPWMTYPGGKGPTGSGSNIHCNMCHECVKSCSLDNMTLMLRMPAKEVVDKVRAKTDEAWQGFIRLGLAVFYEFVFFGSYFWIKDWGNMSRFFGSNFLTLGMLRPDVPAFGNWLKWCVMVCSIALIILPAVFFLFTLVAHKISGAKDKPPLKKFFLALSYALSPFGQLLWMSFGLSLLMVNWAYPFKAFVADPLGWGWAYVGFKPFSSSAHDLFSPFGAQYLPLIQFIFTMVALALALNVTYTLAYKLFKQDKVAAVRTTVVMSVFYLLSSVMFMEVFIG